MMYTWTNEKINFVGKFLKGLYIERDNSQLYHGVYKKISEFLHNRVIKILFIDHIILFASSSTISRIERRWVSILEKIYDLSREKSHRRVKKKQ